MPDLPVLFLHINNNCIMFGEVECQHRKSLARIAILFVKQIDFVWTLELFAVNMFTIQGKIA